MPTEIERKFIVAADTWQSQASAGTLITQGYIARDNGNTVRIRLSAQEAWLTIKGPTKGISRAEFEYPVTLDDAQAMLALCSGALIEKNRHTLVLSKHTWEIDVFHGANNGLVLAEVELSDETEQPKLPSWLGAEVSSDSRYSNSSLAISPMPQGNDLH